VSLSDVSFGLQKWGEPVNVPKPSPPGLVPKRCRRSKPPVSVGDVEDGGLREALIVSLRRKGPGFTTSRIERSVFDGK
jgi:hypothetical protein